MAELRDTLLEITQERVVRLTDDSALLTYRWSSRRGEATYEALMSSVYVRQPSRRLEARPASADAGHA